MTTVMMQAIRSAAVLGAGTMGAQIAAVLANAGVRVLLLDLTKAAADEGLGRARGLKPDPFFTRDQAALITTGGFDDGLERAGGTALRSRSLWDRSLGTLPDTSEEPAVGNILTTSEKTVNFHLGNAMRKPSASARRVTSLRNNEFAATPPPRTTLRAPVSRAALMSFAARTSTTAA